MYGTMGNLRSEKDASLWLAR